MAKRITASSVRLKRVYEPPSDDDGTRVLVDRLWPRGVSKADAAVDEWLKEIAPSTELRQWFGHDPERWDVFRQRFLKEIAQHPDELARLRDLAHKGTVTFVYAAHDELHNNAVVLRQVLLGRAGGR
jgi:uncharacterized protein YeaO (DUF488 family)